MVDPLILEMEMCVRPYRHTYAHAPRTCSHLFIGAQTLSMSFRYCQYKVLFKHTCTNTAKCVLQKMEWLLYYYIACVVCALYAFKWNLFESGRIELGICARYHAFREREKSKTIMALWISFSFHPASPSPAPTHSVSLTLLEICYIFSSSSSSVRWANILTALTTTQAFIHQVTSIDLLSRSYGNGDGGGDAMAIEENGSDEKKSKCCARDQ